MNEPSSLEVQNEVIRLQRAVAEALQSHADDPSEERTTAVLDALRGPVRALPLSIRNAVLQGLADLYAGQASSSVSSARLCELEEENRRLEAALAARPTVAPQPSGPSDITFALAAALGLEPNVARTRDPDLEQRLVGVVQPLVSFVSELVRSYLGATLDPDRTLGGMFATLVTEEIEGTVATGSVATMIGQIRQQIGAQLIAFREACDGGARDLLRQIAPAALAAGAGEGVLRRAFYYRECWENFEKKHDELRTADNLYETFFDGAFRKALHRASRTSDTTTKGGKTSGSAFS